MSGLATLFTVLGIAWAVQLYFAWKQAQRFQKQLETLKKSGTVAIGIGGKRYRGGRAYVALSANDKGVITDGLVLSGLTVIAKGQPFADYKGFLISEVISGDRVAVNRKPKVIEAAKMAAEHLQGFLDRKDGQENKE